MKLTRRAALHAGGAVTMLSATATAARAAEPRRAMLRAPRLSKGARVGLIEPATATYEPFDLQLVEEAVSALGLEPVRATNALARAGYLAGDDKARAEGVNRMFADKKIDALLAVRGGWGAARTLPFLDFDLIRKNPKPLIGYSDITALHLAVHAKTGLVTFHGPNGASAWGDLSVESFTPLLFDAATPIYENPAASEDRLVQRKWRTQTIRGGVASGPLIGGNLTILTSLVGTPYLPNLNGAILFFEDVGEAVYRVDRMLTQLGQAGVLKNVAGVIVGGCTDCDPSPGDFSSFTLTEVLAHHLARLGKPAYRGAFIGHLTDQFTVPIGCRVKMDADNGVFELLEPAVL